MRNQIAAAERAGIHARTINSANTDEWDDVYAAVAAGEVDVLLVSPERLNNPDFRDNVLPELAGRAPACWSSTRRTASPTGATTSGPTTAAAHPARRAAAGIPVLATTATANARVIARRRRAAGHGRTTLVLRGSLDRESLRLGVVRLPDGRAAAGLAGRARCASCPAPASSTP